MPPLNTAVFQDELLNVRPGPFVGVVINAPTAGEAVLLTTESLVLSNDDDGAPNGWWSL
jgi:hypothetical protein